MNAERRKKQRMKAKQFKTAEQIGIVMLNLYVIVFFVKTFNNNVILEHA